MGRAGAVRGIAAAARVTTHSLTLPGVRLHYEVRGDGPLLLLLGAPMPAAGFAPLADALASDHTVVTTDPRGIANSSLDDPQQDSTPELRADDVAAILDDLNAESADVFGSSGGAVTGLALVSRHPTRVRTLIAHEPPVLELLPDAAAQRAKTEEIIDTFHRDGVPAAMAKFMANAGFDVKPEGAPVVSQPSPDQIAHGTRFLAHELRGTAGYVPDIAALTRGPARVVVGIGAASGGLLTYRTSVALADQLGTPPVEFPGDHGGFIGQPAEFAQTLRAVLAV
jgi:pimeloyl-ACP methyl ester carboxylesterase